jgi:hypothetical protein
MIFRQILAGKNWYQPHIKEGNLASVAKKVRDENLRPEPRPLCIVDAQYDGIWKMIQQGWHGDANQRPQFSDFDQCGWTVRAHTLIIPNILLVFDNRVSYDACSE